MVLEGIERDRGEADLDLRRLPDLDAITLVLEGDAMCPTGSPSLSTVKVYSPALSAKAGASLASDIAAPIAIALMTLRAVRRADHDIRSIRSHRTKDTGRNRGSGATPEEISSISHAPV